MSAATDTVLVEREIAIDATPETVWEFLVDPEKATQWMGTSASFDVRPGGKYRVDVIPGNVARGEFVEIDPPRRLVFTWGWEPGSKSQVDPGASTVEFTLVPDGEGTLLRFAHRGLPSEESAASHLHGWTHYLDRLAAVAGGSDPGADPWLSAPME